MATIDDISMADRRRPTLSLRIHRAFEVQGFKILVAKHFMILIAKLFSKKLLPWN